jgi:hypothetical protein
MTKLEDIEKAVERLPPEELAKFRAWFEELQSRTWDAQIERDANTGKLDWLAKEALAEHRDGQSKKI